MLNLWLRPTKGWAEIPGFEMKQKIWAVLMSVALPLACIAQTEFVDSLRRIHNLRADSLGFSERLAGILPAGSVDSRYDLSNMYAPAIDAIRFPERIHPLELGFPAMSYVPGYSPVFSWGSGEIVADGETSIYPGLMRVDSGIVGINQRAGNFDFYLGGIANKYNFLRGIHTQIGLNGNVTYQFLPNASFTAFGTYYFGRPYEMRGGLPMPPAVAGFYGVSKFGGYVNYNAGERVGVMVGGQAVEQVVSRKYMVEPIVTPYVKLGSGKKKVAIGLPVGQILHGLLRR
ncbi:MAG: hypothetical protein K1W02_14505 [Muribaculaceae bacterium]